jgi:hypothetical protein
MGSKRYNNQPAFVPPDLLSGSQANAATGGGNFSLNGGIAPQNQTAMGTQYSPFAGFSTNYNDAGVYKDIAKPVNNGGNGGSGGTLLSNSFKGSYNPFFLRF